MGCNDPFEAGSVAVQTKNFTENWCWKAKGEIEGDKGVIRGGGKYNDWTTQLSCSENKCRDETIGAAKGVDCSMVRYEIVSKSIRYLKRVRSYESIILILIMKDIKCKTITRFDSYRQIQSNLIVRTSQNDNEDILIYQCELIHMSMNHEMILKKMKTLLNEPLAYDNGLFTAINRKEKSLRNVHQEFGSFIWSQAFETHVCRCMVLYSKVIDYFGHAMLLQRRRLLQSGYDYVRTISDLVILHSETGQLRKTMNIWQLYIINRPYCVSYQVKQYEEAHRLLSTALSDLKDEEPFNYTGYATSLDLMGILKLHSNHPELILSLDIVEKLSQINSPVTVVH
ncbi:unnamed protein product [Rotaria magnacalcarata]